MKPEVRKDELVKILRENRRKHHGVYTDAVQGYRKAARDELERRLALLERGTPPREIRVLLYKPEDHCADYDRAIRTVEMHQGDTIVLSEEDMANFVMDDWDWMRAWRKNSSQYAAGSVRATYGEEE